ncbi:hypothetical protein I4U23_009359 [Adineta vaga]|nr:hypothetical protein I4U23_009359 [Adineta vaga]
MLGRRAVGAIVGIISACSLLVLLLACCIVYYRRYLARKSPNESNDIDQTQSINLATNHHNSDLPPSYYDAVQKLNNM